MAPLTKDEENYARLSLLLRGVAPRAVRTYFDRQFPPTSLKSTLSLSTNYNTLLDLKSKRIINQAQWNLLFPRNGVPDSITFDITLMICLIRSLTSISYPLNGFDNLPPPGETTQGSDLARIKWYRNELFHPNNTIGTTYFNTAWRNISNAVRRLGSPTLYQECQELKVKILDQSNQEIMLEIKHYHEQMRELGLTVDNLATNMTKNVEELKSSQSTLQTEQAEVREIIKDPIPQNIRDQIKRQIEDWKKKDTMFVSTRASDYVMECLQDKSCVTLTAPSGVGKSFIGRHTALVLQKEGYQIIPVYSPIEIRDYYQPGMQSVFIVDDICGNFTVNQSQIDNWKQLLPVIDTIIADTCCKIIVCCRLQVFKDEKFNILSPFKSCECNLISDKFCLTSTEKQNIANTYIGTSMQDGVSLNSDFFPLLCSLYNKKKNVDLKEFFKSPFDVYRSELDKLSEHGDEGNFKICGLALCVLFNNQLEEKWFQGKVTDAQRHIIEDTCDACDINRSTSKAKLKKALDTLDDTFICIQNGIYKTLHDKLFDFLAHYFGQKMIECLIDHGDSDLVHQRFIWQKSQNDKTSSIDFIIEIPDDYLESYLERFKKDWSAGKVTDVLCNNNMQEPSFRQKLLEMLNQLNISKQVELVNTKDTVRPKEDCGSGNTPLIGACFNCYTDMVQWILRKDLNVDQCRDDGVTGLLMASQYGHTDIVILLLKKGSNVDLCGNDGYSPLLWASEKGYTDIVNLLLESNPDVNRCDKAGNSPLRQASQDGHTDIVRLLLERNPNVDLCDNNGCSSLSIASHQGHSEIVKLLLNKGSNVNLCGKDGSSPLLSASEQGKCAIVKLLFEKDPTVDLCNKIGCSPLFMASQNGHTDIIKFLLEKGPDVDLCNKDGCSPLIQASQEGHIDIVKLLLEKDSKIDHCDKNGYNALYIASQNGYTDIVKLLLENDSKINHCDKNKSNALCIASQNGHTGIVKLLLERNPNVNQCDMNGSSSLLLASWNGHTEIVKLLLERYPNIDLCNKNGCSPLLLASSQGHIKIVQLLLERHPKVDLSDINGRSPLLLASWNGHTEIVKLLLERNPNVDLCNKDGCSPLLWASEQGYTEIVKLLLERNPNVDLCNKDGCSALLLASWNGHTDIVKLLLKKYPNVDLCNNEGQNPLLMASQDGHTDIVNLLLGMNPDVNLCNNYGYSPLIQASYNGHTGIVRLLLQRNPGPWENTPLSTSYVNNNSSISNSPSLVQPLMKHRPNINAQTYDGGNALYFSAWNGNLEITQILLKNNANCNICIHSKHSIIDTLNKHPTGSLEELKRNSFDSLVESTSSRVTEYVSKKSVEYAFDVVAGSSPLHIACFMGRINVVCCLIGYNVNINMTKEDGTLILCM